ncbi:MAG: multiple sugar transport system permease protein, partial [Actinomycetota bacterium]|nr:multiple sugar transport system permease protein [Actinomycetota bacterium]
MTAAAPTVPGTATNVDASLVGARRGKSYSPEKRRSNLLTVVLWICALYFVFPLFWLLVASTKNNSDLFTSFGLWFGKSFSLFQNLGDVFSAQGGIFLHWALNTVLYAGVSAIGASLLATMAGYAFAKYDFPGGKALFSVTLGAIMIPLTALAIPTYLLFSSAGLTNTPWAVILPSLVSPFGVFL